MKPPGELRRWQLGGLVGLMAAVALLKGLRMPSAWAATHLTFNYSHGFVRRGLVGEILYLLQGRGGPQHYNGLALFAVAIFALVVGATGWLMRRMLATAGGRDLGLGLALLVFLASPSLVFFVHIIGYLDDFAVLLGVGFVLFAARTGPRSQAPIFGLCVGVALAGGAVLALIHEMLTWSFSPAIFFVLLCCAVRGPGGGAAAAPPWRGFLLAFAAWLALLGEAVAVGLLGTRSPDRVQALVQSVAPRVDFPLRGDAFDVLHRSMSENLLHLMPFHWSQPGTLDSMARTTLGAAPGILFLLAYGAHLLGALCPERRSRRALVAAFVVAVVSPHALNFIGWDTGRWCAISLWSALLCVAAMRLILSPPPADLPLKEPHKPQERQEPQAPRSIPRLASGGLALTPGLWVAGLAAVILGLCATTELFDGYVVQWFPFDGQWRSALDLWKGGFHFIPRF